MARSRIYNSFGEPWQFPSEQAIFKASNKCDDPEEAICFNSSFVANYNQNRKWFPHDVVETKSTLFSKSTSTKCLELEPLFSRNCPPIDKIAYCIPNYGCTHHTDCTICNLCTALMWSYVMITPQASGHTGVS